MHVQSGNAGPEILIVERMRETKCHGIPCVFVCVHNALCAFLVLPSSMA